MQSAPVIVGLALLVMLAAVPTASAGHSGPTCTHEYVDYYKDPDTVPNCAHNTVRWVWEFLGIGVVLDPWP